MRAEPLRRSNRSSAGITRAQQTAIRRRQILDATLATINEKGESGTFILDVCARSNVSVGTVYHHFGSKDQLIATLHYTLLNAYQSGAAPILEADPRAEAGIRDTVQYHAQWLVSHPEEAMFLLREPFAGYRSDRIAENLTAENEQFLATVRKWLFGRMEVGELRRVPFDVIVALMIGPIHHWARAEIFRLSRQNGEMANTVTFQSDASDRQEEAVAHLQDGVWLSLRS